MRGAGGPCVAQRVCPMPQWFSKKRSPFRFSLPLTCSVSLSILPVSLRTMGWSSSRVGPLSMAIPAESYPRYSRRRRPFRSLSTMAFCLVGTP